MIWKKPDKKVLNSKALKSAGVVLSNFSAAQASEVGFFLVGTIQFNPAVLEFDEGRAEFALNKARVIALGRGCVFEYESIAYVARISEERTFVAETKKTKQKDSSGSAEAQAEAGIGLTKGVSASAGAKGSLKAKFANTDVTKLKADSARTESLIEAFPRAKKGQEIDNVEWIIRPDELTPLQIGDEHLHVLHGERMRRANENAGLAYVKFAKPQGRINLSLEVRAADIHWTDISFTEGTPLHKLGKRLVHGRSKRDIVGKLALGKALEGAIQLEKLPKK